MTTKLRTNLAVKLSTETMSVDYTFTKGTPLESLLAELFLMCDVEQKKKLLAFIQSKEQT